MADDIRGARDTGAGLRSTPDEQAAQKELDRRALVAHPSGQALRFVAPFIRDAIAAGVWTAGPGTESVEHEIAASLAWLDRCESASALVAEKRKPPKKKAAAL